MALTIDGSTPAKATGTGTAVTTVSFTPPASSLILLGFGSNNIGTTDVSISSMTNTGTAITWGRVARKNKNVGSDGGAGTNGGAEWWSGVGNGGAITVTANGVGTGTGAEKMLKAIVLTSANTSVTNKANATSASGLPSAGLVGTAASSMAFAMSSDWAQAGLGTAGTGQTIIDEHNVAGQITLHCWRTTSTIGGSSQTMNLTAPAAENYNLVAVEVVDSGGTPTATLIHPRALSRVPIIRANNF